MLITLKKKLKVFTINNKIIKNIKKTLITNKIIIKINLGISRFNPNKANIKKPKNRKNNKRLFKWLMLNHGWKTFIIFNIKIYLIKLLKTQTIKININLNLEAKWVKKNENAISKKLFKMQLS